MNTNKFIRWLSLLILSNVFALASQTAAAASDSATLTVGGTCPFRGYDGSYGSYSPTGLTGGKTVVAIIEFYDTCYYVYPDAGVNIQVAGFSSDPGVGWLQWVTCNGVSLGPTSGYISYSYSGGTANWTLNGVFGLYAFGNNGVTDCTVDHS